MVLGTLVYVILVIVAIIIIIFLLRYLFQLFFVTPIGIDYSTDLQRNSIANELNDLASLIYL